MKKLDSLKQWAAKEANELKKTVKDSFVQGFTVDIPETLKAYGRMGASEMAVGLKAFPDSIGPQETTGTVGNPTQQQISQGFGVYGNNYEKDAEANLEPQVQQPEPDNELDLEP